jgi:hypothetical protein
VTVAARSFSSATTRNVASTHWLVTQYKQVGIVSGTPQYYCLTSGTTFNPATAQPCSDPAPPPGFFVVFQNPIQNQHITQPLGTNMTLNGSFVFNQGIFLTPVTVATLPTLTGLTTLIQTSDGNPGSNPCTGGGTGSLAVYQGGQWSCAFGTSGGGSSIVLQTNGATNSNQSLLNLVAGAGVSLVNSNGSTTISVIGQSNESVVFNNVTSATLATTYGTTNLVWDCWDANTPANAILPSNVSVNTSFVVTFSFAVAQSGYCAVNGGAGAGGGGGATSPGGAFNAMQYNNGGIFGGALGHSYNPTAVSGVNFGQVNTDNQAEVVTVTPDFNFSACASGCTYTTSGATTLVAGSIGKSKSQFSMYTNSEDKNRVRDLLLRICGSFKP